MSVIAEPVPKSPANAEAAESRLPERPQVERLLERTSEQPPVARPGNYVTAPVVPRRKRRTVSDSYLRRARGELAQKYDLRTWDIEAGLHTLKITAPTIASAGGGPAVQDAARKSAHLTLSNEHLLHGRDGLAPTPETNARLAPQWHELWPSSRAMAIYLGQRVRMRGVEAIELDCGLGTAGLAAAAKGARVVLSDPNPEALRFARFNTMQSAITRAITMEFDWRRDYLAGYTGALIFSDVLHTEANFEPVLRMLHDNLGSGSTAFLGEPGRPVAVPFYEALRKTKYNIRLDVERVPDLESDNYYLINILRIRKDADPFDAEDDD